MTDAQSRYTNLSQRPYESHYLFLDARIDAPVEKVWPHALNIGSWMTAHRLETIGGESGKIGHLERVYPKHLASAVGHPRYHLYGVTNIIPHKYIGLEVFPEKGGSYGDRNEWMSFDGVLLIDLGGRTQVVFLMVDVQMGSRDQAERERRQQEINEGREMITGYFENLRALVAH